MSFPQTLEVTVRRRHAEQGRPGSFGACALALAIKEQHSFTYVRVDPHHRQEVDIDLSPYEGVHYTLPEEAVAYATAFDNLLRDKPGQSLLCRTIVPADWPESLTFTLTKK